MDESNKIQQAFPFQFSAKVIRGHQGPPSCILYITIIVGLWTEAGPSPQLGARMFRAYVSINTGPAS